MSKIGENIINYLENNTGESLPNFGILGGQSVAEAYFRLKKIPIYTRIKDLDLFINLKNEKYREKYPKFTRNISARQTIKNSVILKKKIEKSASSFDDETFDIISRDNTSYRIRDTFNVGLINVVEVSYDQNYINHKDFLESTIDNFDINAIEIGVCLKTKRVYMTSNFKNFLKTKQVEITKFDTPSKCLCRFLNKSEYYKGAYFDFKYEVNLQLGYYLLGGDKKVPPKKGVSLLKSTYDRLNKHSKKLIGDYFNVRESTFEPMQIVSLDIEKNKKPNYCSRYKNKDFHIFQVSLRENSYSSKKHVLERFMHDIEVKNLNMLIIPPPFDGLSTSSICIHQILNNTIPKNVYSWIKSINGETLPFLFKKKMLEKEDNILTPKMKKYLINTPLFARKKSIQFLASEEIDIVTFSPRLRKFNKNIRETLYYVRNSNKRADQFRSLGSHRNFVSMILNSKKMSLFWTGRKRFNEKYLKRHLKISAVENVDFMQIFQLDKELSAAVLRHEMLYINSVEYHSIKKIPFDLLSYAKAVRRIEKSEYIYILGEIEEKKMPIIFIYKELDEIEKVIKARDAKEMERNTVVPLDKKSLSFKDYKINQVYTTHKIRAIGQEMNHCIGGYSQSVTKNKALVFDVYDNKNRRYTLHVKKNNKEGAITFKHFQIKMKSNKLASKKVTEDMHKFLDILLDQLNLDILNTNKKD